MFSAYLCTTLVFLAATTASAVSSARSLSLEIAGPTIVNGVENLKVVAMLTNTGNETLKLLKDPNSVLHTIPADSFTIIADDGASPSFAGVRLKYSPIQTSKSTDPAVFTVLAPGANVSVTHDLSSAYNFSNTGHGKYTINAASTRFQYVGPDNELSTINATPGPAHVTTLSGGKLAILRRPGLLKKRTARPNFNGCSNSQQRTLRIAAASAQSYVSATTSYLKANAHSTPRYTAWFGAYDGAHYGTVLNHFARLSAHNNAFSEFAYDCTCADPAVYAYVYPDQFGAVYLCGAFWGAPVLGADSQAGTLVHEASHFTANGGTRDFAYGRAESQALARGNPDEAVLNADSHEYFAEDTPSQA